MVFERGAVKENQCAVGVTGISPTDEESPPAPLSVIELYRSRSRARSRKSIMRFCVMGSPICTAVTGEPSWSGSDENVRSMDAVFADPAADHDDMVADVRLFFVSLVAVDFEVHQPQGPAIDKGFAQIPFIENDRPIDRSGCRSCCPRARRLLERLP